MKIKDFLAGTLIGHIVLVETLLASPVFVVGLWLNTQAGTLNFGTALEMALMIFGAGAGAAFGLWFTVTRQLARQRRTDR